MEKSVFFLFFTLLILSCLIVAQVNTAAPTISRDLKEARERSHNTVIDESLFDASKLIIDESRLIGGQAAGQKEKDKIESLPGQPTNVKFNQYGGHVIVDEKAGRALFYYFAEAREYHQDSLPLLIWISGCTSFGAGAMEEMGPFRVYSDGQTLYENYYAWNQVANVLFLESPAGYGFSYSNTTTDYTTGDKKIAIDNYNFLVRWLDRFPEYKKRDIYLGGEGDGGHFVPQLAQIILNQNAKNSSSGIIKLKGIIIGHGNLDKESQRRGQYEYWGSHALISDDSENVILKYCNFSHYITVDQPYQCTDMVHEIQPTVNSINIDNIYATPCPSSTTTTKKPNKASVSIFEFDPCSDIYVTAYLNRPDVKRALHANAAKIPWKFCSDIVKWTDDPSTVLPIIRDLMNHGLPVWIYRGDLDGGPRGVTSAQLAIKAMKLDIKDYWRPWYSNTRKHREVAGYTQEYKDNLIFATVRGAGYLVQSYQPERALTLITSFLAGKKLPIS